MRTETFVIAVLAVALGGCPGTLDDPGRFGSTTCSDPVKEVFAPTCAQSGCHSTADSDNSGKLDLEAPNVAQRLRGKKANGGNGLLIDPASPEKSVLLTKLKSPVPFGSRMPLGLPVLDAAKLKCVHDWVVANAGGAPADGGAGDSGGGGDGGGDTGASVDAAGDAGGD